MKIGHNMKQLRESRGWSQRELALRSGVSQPMICQLETGHSMGTPESWMKIADVLGVTISDLWKEDADGDRAD